MKNRILRVALVMVAVAGLAAAGFFVFQAEQGLATARAASAGLGRDIERIGLQVGELRGAHLGMVAHGQDPSFWVSKVAGLVQDASAGLQKIDRAALAADAAQDLGTATEALSSFTRTSDRVRDLLATDQPLTASSVAFGDATQKLTRAASALASIPGSLRQAMDARAAAVRLQEAYALAGAAGLCLLVMLLLLPRVAAPVESSPLETGEGPGLSLNPPPAEVAGGFGFDGDMRGPVQANGDPLPEPPHRSEVELARDLRTDSQLRLNTPAQVDLVETARLCGDLAKVKDGAELPRVLARAADVIDASGIVVWIAEPGGSVLRPAASHGYSDQTMARMKGLPAHAENAVSVAFSTGRLQIVRGSGDRNGAVVAPIDGSNGCVGAMAAEVRHGGETSDAIRSVATIVAAQLASLVADTTPV